MTVAGNVCADEGLYHLTRRIEQLWRDALLRGTSATEGFEQQCSRRLADHHGEGCCAMHEAPLQTKHRAEQPLDFACKIDFRVREAEVDLVAVGAVGATLDRTLGAVV